MQSEQLLFLLILAGGLYLFVSERLRIDVSAMLVLLALVLGGVLDAKQALSGFASEPAIMVAALAAFTHHVMVTAMMLPILVRHARERKLPASRLLMPMSLAASLGTTLTLVSAPAFLLADDLIERSDGHGGLGIFSITPIGIALVVVGMVYMQLARWLLPKRSGAHG